MEASQLLANKTDHEALTAALKKLIGAAVDFPSKVKQRILGWRLSRIVMILITPDGDLSEDRRDELMAAMNPFGQHTIGTGEQQVCATGDLVDPLRPTMADLDGDLLGKTDLCKKVFVHDMLKPMMEMGGDMATATLLVVRKVMVLFENAIEDMDDIPACVEEVLGVCRGLEAILDTTALDLILDDVEKFDVAIKRGSSSAIAEVAALIYSNKYYDVALRTCLSFLGSATDSLPRLQSLYNDTAALLADEEDVFTKIADAMADLNSFSGRLRPGSTYQLEVVLQGKLESACVLLKIKFDAEANKKCGAELYSELLERMVEAKTALAAALLKWPASDKLQAFCRWATEAMSAHEKDNSLQRLRSALREALDNGIKHLGALRVVAESCAGVVLSDPNDIDLIFKVVQRATPTAMQSRNDLAAASCLLSVVGLLPDSDDKALCVQACSLVDAALDMQEAAKAFEALGEDEEARPPMTPTSCSSRRSSRSGSTSTSSWKTRSSTPS